jgi:tetratricopeptide (TPR) repeat protein
MKRARVIALVLALCWMAIDVAPAHALAPAAAQAPAQDLAREHANAAASDHDAIDAYRRGDLDSARTLWLASLESLGRAAPAAERARMLYNLGDVAYRRKQVLEAVGWYTAALRLSPRDADIWWNLEHARSDAKLEPADRGDLSATLRRLVSSLTLAESEWLVLGSVALWSVALAIEALRGGRVWRRVSLALALAVLASLAPWVFNLARASRHPLLAIQEGKLELRSEPRSDAPAIAEVAAGDEVEAVDELPEWRKVELENGLQGWTRKSAVFALDR